MASLIPHADIEVRGIVSRQITGTTCEHFGYGYARFKGKKVQVATYHDADGKAVAQKLRFQDKKFVWLGDPKDALPYGATKFPRGGKSLVVTEGEIDALSMSQAQGNKWPVVSISCGAGPQIRKYFAQHKAYFDGFERVILMFDMDEAGRTAAKAAAEVLGPRARIAEIDGKDPNEVLMADKADALVKSMWNAQPHRPEGIVDMSTLRAAVKERPREGLSWPFEALTKLTYGIRLGESYAVGAGTGVGKTDFFTQTMDHMVNEHQVPIGVFSLEQGVRETALRLTGKRARRPLHIPELWDEDIFDAAWDELEGSGKVFLYDSFGANEWDVIRGKIEYLVHAEGVRHFFLDHLTALAAAEDDERTALERIMAEMGALLKKLDITIFFISHLATPDGKPHEEGGRVMIRHFKGSRAIGFWSHFMFGMERDQQAEDVATRQTTTFRVLKDRYTGRSTGKVFYLGYEEDTGLLHETDAPDAGEKYGFSDTTNSEPNPDF